ncbi:MAG: zinc metalloprotease [Mycobacteriales bacterium]
MATLPALSAVPVAAASTHGNRTTSSCTAKAGGAANARSAAPARSKGPANREPMLHQKAIEVPHTMRAAAAKFSATIPVYFHVVSSGSVGNVSTPVINDQIKVLNNTYAGGEGGAATGFAFRLAGVTRTKNATWYNAGPESAQEKAMKKALHKGNRSALNLYSTSGGGYLGWAEFPNLSNADLYLDGVVMDWRSMRGASTAYAGQYDQGETATHETGHWLNLYHVFEGGCTAPGDHVADTPRQSTATHGCPTNQDSCKSFPGKDNVHNYMDYSYDGCYTSFTPGQVQRMQDAWTALRAAG